MRKLGANQKGILKHMARQALSEWWPGCGWEWGNITDITLYSMVKHGFVEIIHDDKARNGAGHYRLTDAGRAWVEAH